MTEVKPRGSVCCLDRPYTAAYEPDWLWGLYCALRVSLQLGSPGYRASPPSDYTSTRFATICGVELDVGTVLSSHHVSRTLRQRHGPCLFFDPVSPSYHLATEDGDITTSPSSDTQRHYDVHRHLVSVGDTDIILKNFLACLSRVS